MSNFAITFFGSELLQDTTLELNCGRRYGLIGLNGCGKSSLLAVLGNREVPIPEHIDIFHLTREIPASTKSALQCVMEVDEERMKLEKLADELATREDDESQDQLMDVYDRLDDMNADQAEMKAARILHGLGFTKEMQQKQAKDFSGGWRMRIALYVHNETLRFPLVCIQFIELCFCLLFYPGREHCSSSLTCCCWTNRPIIWIWMRACGLKRN